jgi:hypothetical protein
VPGELSVHVELLPAEAVVIVIEGSVAPESTRYSSVKWTGPMPPTSACAVAPPEAIDNSYGLTISVPQRHG